MPALRYRSGPALVTTHTGGLGREGMRASVLGATQMGLYHAAQHSMSFQSLAVCAGPFAGALSHGL